MSNQERLLDLERRWRLRSRPPDAFWDIDTFTSPPDGEPVRIALNLHNLEELLTRHPCLFLLGRPGAGKTAEFKLHFTPEKRPDETIIALEARELDRRGAGEIFDGPEWKSALGAGKPIRVVFDSVDEALLSCGSFLDGLRRRVKLAKVEAEKARLQLSLVLTCRQGWNEEIVDQIAELWGTRAAACTYELAPLSEEAALKLAEHHGVEDRAAFQRSYRTGDMASYACWPRTLIWLAKEFARYGSIFSNLTEMHRRRCERQFDADRHARANITPRRIADWNAAVELLACVAIATGMQRFAVDASAEGDRVLDVAELARVREKLPAPLNAGLPPNREAFHDVLLYGDLFEPVGNAWMFQEQSDAEFLAARRLARLPVEQLASFFGKQTPRGWQIFPQLAATAAIGAVHSDAFREFLLNHDPLVLMRSDFAVVPEAGRERAVDAFLHLIESGNAPDADDQPAHFQTLRHRNLAEQLSPFLRNTKFKPETRSMALLIAAECANDELGKKLADDIWQLVNCPEVDTLRWLPRAVTEIGVFWTKEQLLALATRKIRPDRHWSLCGAALFALFDDRRESDRGTLREVVSSLVPNPTGVISLYDSFLYSCHRYLRVGDAKEVCAILETLGSWTSTLDSVSPLHKLAEATLKAAVRLIPNPDVTEALAKWWLQATQQHDPWLPGEHHSLSPAEIGLDDSEKRRAFLAALFKHPGVQRLDSCGLDSLPCEPADLPWLLQRLPECQGLEEKLAAHLIGRCIRNRQLREENLEAFRAACRASRELRSLLPAAPDGDFHAELCRKEDEAERKIEEWKKNRPQIQKRPKHDGQKELAAALDDFDKGDTRAWPRMLVALSEPKNSEYGTGYWGTTDPAQLSGWEKLGEEARPTVIRAARTYLMNHPPELTSRGEMSLSMVATIHALSLLRHELSTDSELCAAFRSEWAAVMFRSLYPSRDPLPEVIEALHQARPEAVIDCVREDTAWLWDQNRSLPADHLSLLWQKEPALLMVFCDVLGRSPLQPVSYTTGIAWLMRQDRNAAADLALRRCEELSAEPRSDSRRVALGTALLAFPEHWRRVWPLVASDAEEGRLALAWVAHHSEYLGWQKHLFEKAEEHGEFISALYGWLMKHLPPEPERRATDPPAGIDHCRDLERECHGALLNLGRADLLQAAFNFAGVGSAPWAQRAQSKSELNAQARQWQPWPLEQFVEWLFTEGGTRVTDNDSLLAAVEAALRRFENRWKEMPHHFLWDVNKREPLREKEHSDALKHYLEQDLGRMVFPRNPIAIINRESQFSSGERRDLFVEMPLPDGNCAKVVIEVKLCDNDDVETAMETQLAERYLRRKNLTHGIYFVGWMTCADWPDPPNRFQRRGLAGARRFLEKQAARLSRDGLSIRALVVPCPLEKQRRKTSKLKTKAPRRRADA